MDTEPDPQGGPDATCDLPATAASETAFEPPPSEPAPNGTGGDATGDYHLTDPGASAQTEAETGDFAVGDPNATGAFAPTDGDATGAYVPGTVPLHARPTHDATGAYDLSGTATPGGARPGEARCGHYVLRKFHAKGGMGEIWLAEDPRIGRHVALKRMFGTRPDQQHRFRLEARITGQLEHPGIVPVHELGTNELDQPFYTMKFVRGQTLQKVVEDFHAADPARPTREVEQFRLLQIFLSLCQTVAYAHSRKVLHRDLKPENVMLGPFGETLVLDWGIAKVMGQPDVEDAGAGEPPVSLGASDPETETRAGAVMGTPSYMSPEVAAGRTEDVDQRSDVYLLGATLYEILTGRRPRQGKTVYELLKIAQQAPATAPSRANPRVPRALDAICLKAMALDRADRYQDALSLADDVQRYIAGEPVSAYREPFSARAWRWAKRHRAALVRSAAAVVVAVGSFAVAARLREAERHRAEAVRVADRLKAEERARAALKEFRRRADEARFYAATTDPVSEHAPYFDPAKGEAAARAALALADPWGPTLDGLPLAEERDPLRRDLHDLLVLTAQARARRDGPEAEGRATLALLDRAARLAPPSPDADRLRARVLDRIGDPAGATAARARADGSTVAPTALDRFLRGEALRSESAERERAVEPSERKAWQPDPDRFARALDEYRQALALDPDDYWSLFQLGRCELTLGRVGEAVETLGACVALRPDAPWGYSVRGLALAQQHRDADAARDLDRAVRLAPEARPLLLNRGVVAWMSGRTEAALADFDAVLQPPEARRLVEAAFYRGQVHLQRGATAEALADFDRVAAEAPGLRPVYPYRARLLIAQGKNDRALADLDAYLAGPGGADAPPDWRTHARRGRLLRLMHAELPADQKRKPSARALLALGLAELRRAADAGGDAPELFDDLGALLELSGRRDEAIAAYGRGIDRAPRDAKLLIKRGWALEQAGRRDRALDDFNAAAVADPENAEAHTGIGYLRALARGASEAQREADLALLHGGGDYLILHNVACIHAALADAVEERAEDHRAVAIAVLRRAVALWRQAAAGPSEVDLIRGEPAFRTLRDRRDFQNLIGPVSTTGLRPGGGG